VGVVVPPRDVTALRTTLLELATDDARREHLAQLARKRAESLSWDACVDGYEDALLEVARNRSSAATLGREGLRCRG
jgi:glycosyltransferase involved in cell wall biosynthesis